MEGKTFKFGFNELNLSVSQIENVIGFNENDDREFVASLIEKQLKEAEEFADVRAEYRIFSDVSFINESKQVVINSLCFDVRKIVFAQIKRSGSVALFLCTAGAEIGRRSRTAMQEKDLLTGYIYDVIGSEIVEAAADLMQDEMERSASLSVMKITNRYSPGYCDWNVGEQHKLFSFFPDNYCGIRLTPSALMDPVKSVSGIIGIGENVKRNDYTCRVCEMKDCIYRRSREEKLR